MDFACRHLYSSLQSLPHLVVSFFLGRPEFDVSFVSIEPFLRVVRPPPSKLMGFPLVPSFPFLCVYIPTFLPSFLRPCRLVFSFLQLAKTYHKLEAAARSLVVARLSIADSFPGRGENKKKRVYQPCPDFFQAARHFRPATQGRRKKKHGCVHDRVTSRLRDRYVRLSIAKKILGGPSKRTKAQQNKRVKDIKRNIIIKRPGEKGVGVQ